MKFIDAALEAAMSQELPNVLKEKKLQSANALKALKTFPPKQSNGSTPHFIISMSYHILKKHLKIPLKVQYIVLLKAKINRKNMKLL